MTNQIETIKVISSELSTINGMTFTSFSQADMVIKTLINADDMGFAKTAFAFYSEDGTIVGYCNLDYTENEYLEKEVDAGYWYEA